MPRVPACRAAPTGGSFVVRPAGVLVVGHGGPRCPGSGVAPSPSGRGCAGCAEPTHPGNGVIASGVDDGQCSRPVAAPGRTRPVRAGCQVVQQVRRITHWSKRQGANGMASGGADHRRHPGRRAAAAATCAYVPVDQGDPGGLEGEPAGDAHRTGTDGEDGRRPRSASQPRAATGKTLGSGPVMAASYGAIGAHRRSGAVDIYAGFSTGRRIG